METIELRESVRKFATKMELKLRENEHKGGWEDMAESELVAKMLREIGELLTAEACITGNHPEDEAIDIANFAMMYYDNSMKKLTPLKPKGMKAEDKAQELVNEMHKCMPFEDVKLTSCDEHPKMIAEMELLSAKQCSLIAVDEMLQNDSHTSTIMEGGKPIAGKRYWQKVKQAIEKL